MRPATPLPRTRTSYTVRSLRRRVGAGRHCGLEHPAVDGDAAPNRSRCTTLSISRVAPTRAASATSTSPSSRLDRAQIARRRAPRRTRGRRAARAPTVRLHDAGNRLRIALAADDCVRGRAQRPGQHGRRRALFGREIGVAARQREPSGSRTSGQPTTSTGRSRSAAMRRTTASCCASLRPKYARHGPTIENSFVDDRRDAVEVRRARRAAQVLGEARDVHGRQRRARVHLVDGRREHARRRPRPRSAARSSARSRG